MTLTVPVSETLFLVSAKSVGGSLVERQWTFRGVTKIGFNCGFTVPIGAVPGTYALVEADVGGANGVSTPIDVTPDPYTTVAVGAGEDLTPLIAGAKDLTRFKLAGSPATFTLSGVYVKNRVQLVGPATIVLTSGFGLSVWATTAKLGLISCTFQAVTGVKLNSQRTTGLGAAYVPMGSLTAVGCLFNGIDFGIKCDSTPDHQATGVLVELCSSSKMYAQTVWLSGTEIDVDSVAVAASTNLMEHPIRSSIVNLTTNQLPTFVRIASSKFDATHDGATPTNAEKESGAFRDGKLFSIRGNTFVGWVGVGQGTMEPWDCFGEYVIDGNIVQDPSTAKGTGTINIRVGCNLPGTVSNNTCAEKIIVTAHTPPAMSGNKP